MSDLEEARSILEVLVENPPTTEQCTSTGYKWLCTYCSAEVHDEQCIIHRANKWLNPNKETNSELS